MSQAKLSFRPTRRHLVVVLLGGIAAYVLVPQLGDFRSSWQLLRHPRPGFVVAAIGLTAATYLAAAATYCLLAVRPLRFGRTLLVQLAAMCINRLLPAGVGALGANYLYLKREGHTLTQAASVVAINNCLGFIGHGLVVVLVLLIFPTHLAIASGMPDHSFVPALQAIAVTGLAVGLLGLVLGRSRFQKVAGEMGRQLLRYRRRPGSLAGALMTSGALTVCNVLCLASCEWALGIHVPLLVTLLILTFGVGAGAVTPTPGGLGGFEAAMVTGFLAYGVSDASALAVALLYRLVSYWVPLGIGVLALIVCQRRKLFEPRYSRL